MLYVAQPLGSSEDVSGLADGLYVYSPKLTTPDFGTITATPLEINIAQAIPASGNDLTNFLRGAFIYFGNLTRVEGA